MKDKTRSLENLSPKQKAKMEKIEAKLAKRREKERKVIILDNFGKKLIKTFVVIAFLSQDKIFLFLDPSLFCFLLFKHND